MKNPKLVTILAKHKATGETHEMCFLVLAEKNEDPVSVVHMAYDLSGMEPLETTLRDPESRVFHLSEVTI